MDWNKVSFVTSGKKRRTSIALSLLERPKTSKELSKEFRTTEVNVLTALRALTKEGLLALK